MTIKSSQTLVNEALKEIKTLDPVKVKELAEQNKCILVDIRDIRELWNEGEIENSNHVPRGMLEFWLDPSSPYYKKEKFGDESKEIILFCAGGMRSALAAKTLKDMGYKNVAHVEGGFGMMREVGFKINELKKD
tara:strand:- start:29 stop:430 length:402 start_codon:yes stop_codon:yes gene_type:complete